MAEKQLTEATWKTFAKGKTYKDAALVKALGDFARAERDTPQAQIKSVDALETQADALLKLHKGDKEFSAYVAELGKAADRTRMAAELAVKKATELAEKKAKEDAKVQAKEQADGDEGDEEESPALLTTKMLPLLRLVLKGEGMHALVASGGKQVAVMLARRPIPMGRRKILAEQLQGAGSIKYFAGHCVREDGATTFILQAQVAGLAKKLKAALLAQTGLRVSKLRCRGEDGETDDDDDDGAAPIGAPSDGPADGAAPPPEMVALGKARLEWGQARAHAVSELARLKSLLQAEYRDATDEQEALAKALQRLDSTIAAMDEALSDQLDGIVNAQASERATLAASAKTTLTRLIGFVGSDQILSTIDGNELAPEMKVALPLRERLQAISAALG